jgi:NifB/MoaA-like Fe-S oxidoreductase
MDAKNATRILEQVEAWGERALRERGETWIAGSDELYLLAGRELPPTEFYGEFAQIENGVGAVTYLRKQMRDGLNRLHRIDGMRIGVVTGKSMEPLMPELLAELHDVTGATFELIPMVNTLFGPAIGTAGLLVGADLRAALQSRTDLDLALIPAETINDDGLFLDDDSLAALRAAMPMPVLPSYDFIDVLERSPLEAALAA